MSPTYESIPSFQGNLSPDDTVIWLQNFVEATTMHSDSGILRLLSSKLVAGSPARAWFDELGDELKTSWIPFERHFRARWLTAPLALAQEDAKWVEFCNHRLTYEMVFAHKSLDGGLSKNVVIDWTKDHLRLGQATNHSETELVERTLSVLPAFIQAHVEVYITYVPSDFGDFCSEISAISSHIYELEWHRRQKSLKDTHPLQAQIDEISEKVDSILATLGNSWIGGIGVPPVRTQDDPKPEVTKPEESVAWEPCSPLTSIASEDIPRDTNASETPTPVAEQTTLPVLAEVKGASPSTLGISVEEDTLFVTPRLWRKPISNLAAKDRIEIVAKAIRFVLKFSSVISDNRASNVNSAVTIYDRLTGRHAINENARILFPSNGIPDILWHAIEMIHQYRANGHPFTLHECRLKWDRLVSKEKIRGYFGLHYVYPDRPFLETAWDGGSTALHKQLSGKATMAGGICSVFSGMPKDSRVISDKTVFFMTFASYLAECTNDPEFLEFAIQSATCIKTYMMDLESQLVLDCQFDAPTGQKKAGSTPSCHLTGIFVEGLSVLATVTGDDMWRSLAVSVAEAAMNSRSWHGSNGILSVDLNEVPSRDHDIRAFKGLLNRGLMAAYQRNPSNKPFRQMVRSYINVQFNALRDLASRQDSYGVSWMGPYVGPYHHGQIAALDTLIAAIAVNES